MLAPFSFRRNKGKERGTVPESSEPRQPRRSPVDLPLLNFLSAGGGRTGRSGRSERCRQPAVELQAPSLDFLFLHGLRQGAIRFTGMTTIVEPALANIGTKLNECPAHFLMVQVLQAELLDTWRIDNASVLIQIIKSGVSGRMATGVERGGNISDSAFRSGNEPV